MTNYFENKHIDTSLYALARIADIRNIEFELFENIKRFHESIEKKDYDKANDLTSVIDQQKSIYAKYQAV